MQGDRSEIYCGFLFLLMLSSDDVYVGSQPKLPIVSSLPNLRYRAKDRQAITRSSPSQGNGIAGPPTKAVIGNLRLGFTVPPRNWLFHRQCGQLAACISLLQFLFLPPVALSFAEHRSGRPKTPSDFLKVHSRGLLRLRVEIHVVFHPLDLLFLPILLDDLSCCFFDDVWLFADPNFIIAILFLPILLDFHRMIVLGNRGFPFIVEVEEGPERIPTPNVAGLAPCPSSSTTEPCSESPSSASRPGLVTDLGVGLGIGSQIRRKVDRFRSGVGGRSSILAHSRSRFGDLCRVSNLSMGKG
ncbi:hypothetical protein U1Q18_028166 [Sarracenia purpurea var. burkii]